MELEFTDRKMLREYLVSHFNLKELKTLAFDIGTNYDLFPHEESETFSRELIAFCERQQMLNLLITETLSKRPDHSLAQLLAKLPPLDAVPIKMQIIVSNEKLDDMLEILDVLATKLNCRPDEIQLIGAAWDSIRLLLSFSTQSVDSLSKSQIRDLVERKYKVVSISDFYALDTVSQETWLYIACNHPPNRNGNLLQSTVFWNYALEVNTRISLEENDNALKIIELSDSLQKSQINEARISTTSRTPSKRLQMDSGKTHSNLIHNLENTLQQKEIKNEKLYQNINMLLHRSVEYGRASRVLGENPDSQACQEYVDNVISFYEKYFKTVNRLERQDRETWIATIAKIQMWANGYLKRRGIHDSLRAKSVEECVPNAVLAFLSSVYHYDTEFDAWFCVLVQNVCRKYIQEQTRSGRILEREAVSIDEIDYLLEKMADSNELDSQQQRELRAELLEAIKRLSSEARQQLIIDHYFSGYSFKEIAADMNKSMTAVYKLHFDALNDLRGNLGNN